MQRYTLYIRKGHNSLDDEAGTVPTNNGMYVLFVDAQAKSLSDERRIAELEKVLTESQEYLRKVVPGFDDYVLGQKVRAALRVETQEKI